MQKCKINHSKLKCYAYWWGKNLTIKYISVHQDEKKLFVYILLHSQKVHGRTLWTNISFRPLKTKLWYLENEMITEQGYISSKDIRRAPGEVWKVAFPKVKINIREQTSPRASFPQKVKVLKTETIFSQIRNAISFWIRVLNLCYWRLWNSLIWNLDSRWRFCTEKN